MTGRREPGRYLLVGAACALFNNIILIGGDAAGLHYAVSVLLTFVLMLPLSYLAHASWTFDATVNWPAFGRFLLGSLSSLAMATFAVGLFHDALRLPMVLAAPVATVVMTVYNFLMTRWAVRRRQRS
ncbi:GtrA family protein [Sphingobium sufflavum]|uniref:GtrA family protein n=1 Tax=Sphingobium sufflavum TaxID=1129547 RepID=UPI001F48709F|nr:GtrA family protein [Sphingobium sufflavum]MCE7797469.1 GtrA family protein [Sphingobium sufflavum]